jgi:hypothetical protein
MSYFFLLSVANLVSNGAPVFPSLWGVVPSLGCSFYGMLRSKTKFTGFNLPEISRVSGNAFGVSLQRCNNTI